MKRSFKIRLLSWIAYGILAGGMIAGFVIDERQENRRDDDLAAEARDDCLNAKENREALFLGFKIEQQLLGEEFGVDQQTIEDFQERFRARIEPEFVPLDC